MKIKFLLAILFVVGLGFTSMAQTISVGPRVGATFSTIKTDEDEEGVETESITGLQIGGVLNVGLNDYFSIQPELLYVQKGSKATMSFSENFEGGEYTFDGSAEAKLSYLELPILAKASFGNENLKGFITAGPTFGYWLNGKMKVNATERYSDDFSEFEESYSEQYDVDFDNDDDGEENRFETGASFGAGLGYKLGAGMLNIEARYTLGLSSINETSEEDDTKSKNRVFGISVAYLFSL